MKVMRLAEQSITLGGHDVPSLATNRRVWLLDTNFTQKTLGPPVELVGGETASKRLQTLFGLCSSKTFAAQNGCCPRSESTPSLAMEASNSDQRTCTFCRAQAELPEVAQRQVVRWLQQLVEKSIHKWLAIPPQSLTVRP